MQRLTIAATAKGHEEDPGFGAGRSYLGQQRARQQEARRWGHAQKTVSGASHSWAWEEGLEDQTEASTETEFLKNQLY